ncbi:hypothetical protein LY76DRAFT_7386 [Colletotrichum caudatum]|nr:hypothetical protein LY76DRAFT_7386 [Colletotrichum caudatum]
MWSHGGSHACRKRRCGRASSCGCMLTHALHARRRGAGGLVSRLCMWHVLTMGRGKTEQNVGASQQDRRGDWSDERENGI